MMNLFRIVARYLLYCVLAIIAIAYTLVEIVILSMIWLIACRNRRFRDLWVEEHTMPDECTIFGKGYSDKGIADTFKRRIDGAIRIQSDKKEILR